MDEGVKEVEQIYEQLWSNSVSIMRTSGPRIDSLLQDRRNDQRRCVTLVARPDSRVQAEIGAFLKKAAEICPGQYYYQPAELHLTVLAVISGSELWRKEIRWLQAYRIILEEVLQTKCTFSVRFRGVTLSPEAVMIQGFPFDHSLDQLRDELRNAFREQGFGEKLDRRYKISTAHLTAMRFIRPVENGEPLLGFLEAHREGDFGETRFQTLQLIWSDWCASRETVRVLQEYQLKS